MSWVITPSFTQWTPSLITTALWLDAADASTVTASSSLVDEWRDKSGNARHATGTTTTRPAYTSAGLNGRNVITFDGTDDFLSLSGITLDTDNTFVFSVYQRSSAGIHSIDVGSIPSSQVDSTRGYGNWWFSDNVLYSQLRSSSPSTFGTHGTASTSTGVFINSLARNSTGTQAWRNGSTLGTRQQVGAPLNPVLSYVGRQGATSGGYTNGYIAEIIVGRFDISDLDRQKTEGYLAHKWGLTANLPNDHPYKVNPPAP
jgi:hypothetical protein